MDMQKQTALACIDQVSDLILEMSDAIWDAAELGFHEAKSAQLQLNLLEKLLLIWLIVTQITLLYITKLIHYLF